MELKSLSNPLRYVVCASLIALFIYVVASLLPVEKWTSHFTARLVTFLGIPATSYAEHGRIYLEYLQISIDCTALEIIALFLGLILAAPAPLSKRLIFSTIGAVTVFVANILRIGTVYYLLEKGIPWYAAHDLFSATLAILAGVLFLTVSEHYLPQINENLYLLLDAAEHSLSRIR